jgi:hypothetical protein
MFSELPLCLCWGCLQIVEGGERDLGTSGLRLHIYCCSVAKQVYIGYTSYILKYILQYTDVYCVLILILVSPEHPEYMVCTARIY